MSKLKISCAIIIPFVVISLNSCVYGAPTIVTPYPNNPYAIENEKAKVTCVVEDTVSNPDEIVFVRKNRFGDITPIRDEGPGGRIYYQNETLGDGSKLRVTLHFNKVILNDDSRYGGYECQGHTRGSQHDYGFTVTIIERNELPSIEVSNNVTAKLGDKIVLSCNLTISQAAVQTKLTRMMWAKDGKIIEEVLYPRQQPLKPLKIDVDRPEVGGIYTCHLTSKLRNVKEYNVTDDIYVTVKDVSGNATTPSVEFSSTPTKPTTSPAKPTAKPTAKSTAKSPAKPTAKPTSKSPVSSVGKASLTPPIILLGFLFIWLLHG